MGLLFNFLFSLLKYFLLELSIFEVPCFVLLVCPTFDSHMVLSQSNSLESVTLPEIESLTSPVFIFDSIRNLQTCLYCLQPDNIRRAVTYKYDSEFFFSLHDCLISNFILCTIRY